MGKKKRKPYSLKIKPGSGHTQYSGSGPHKNKNTKRSNNPNNKERGGRESSEDVIIRNLEFLQEVVEGKVQMIPRVGYDVKASCEMFTP